jgi:hypothetical protein
LEDYTAPLGLDRLRQAPASARRLGPLVLGLLVLLVVFVGGWAVLFNDPHGGEPRLVVDLPKVPAVLPEPAAQPQAEPPDDNGGQIIIRDP